MSPHVSDKNTLNLFTEWTGCLYRLRYTTNSSFRDVLLKLNKDNSSFQGLAKDNTYVY